MRLTAHPGLELFAKFSPDGQWIAFTGQYDGDEQVYVIPATGGVPRQLTFYPTRGPLPPRWGYDDQVYGWTPDGKSVVFRSLRDGWNLGEGRLFTVPMTGGLPVALPMPQSGAGDRGGREDRGARGAGAGARGRRDRDSPHHAALGAVPSDRESR